MQTLLITGGSGFIGSHTSLVLLEAGFNLIIIDSFINSSIEALFRVKAILKSGNSHVDRRLKIIEGDIRNHILLEKIFHESKNNGTPINAVVHFAGLKSVNESVINPLEYWNVNVFGTINLLEVMAKNNCKTIVFSSSATIYGLCNSDKIKEETPINPISPYGETKATVEKILNNIFLSNKNDWRIANLRYFNPVGAHPSGLIGEDPKAIPNNLFPNITKVALNKINHLKIYGNDWETIDGTGVRDYIHVMDLAEGHKAALDYLFVNDPQLINLNIGNGKGISVLEFITNFESANKCSIPYKFYERREGDIPISVASNELSKRLLKWQPKRTIYEICKDGWNWQMLNPTGYEK